MKTTRLVRASGVTVLLPLLLAFVSCAVARAPDMGAGTARRTPIPAATSTTPPALGLGLLDQPPGVKVIQVAAGSLAAAAGVRPGDIIVRCNSRPVSSAAAFSASTRNRPADAPLELQLLRRGSAVTVIIPAPAKASAAGSGRPLVPGGAGRDREALAASRRQIRMDEIRGRASAAIAGTAVATGPVSDPFQIPGLAAREPAMSGINVLRRVLLDPQTGEIAFVGVIDPAYPTGPIDYTTLLHDALRSPAPFFSLEPTPATRSAVDGFIRQMDQQMAANLSSIESGKAWLIGVFDQLLTNPGLELDRRRFLVKGAEILHVKPEEVPTYLQVMLGRSQPGSKPWVDFWIKLYQRLDAPQAGEFIRAAANKAADPAAFQMSLDGLGLTPLIERLREQVRSGAVAEAAGERQLEVEIWVAIYTRCKVPEGRWRTIANRAVATGDLTAFHAACDLISAEMIRESVMDPWLNGLVLSEDFLRVMHRMPPLEVAPVYRGNLASDSELARTFLAADWMLKTLAVSPELASRVSGHLTPTQFAFRRETALGVYDVGNVEARLWLTPEAVELRQDPAGTVLDFGAARPAVRSEVLSHHGGSPQSERLMRDSAVAYGREITRRYDEYARALPELHQLREAAKVLALVHWAHARGLKLIPPGPAASGRELPASFHRGFWTGFFLSNPEKTYFGLAADGGVDFSPEVGTAWLKTREDPGLGSTALQQLTASAALGQQAADAASRGDLESARGLADQSARAMTGDFDFSGHPALGNIPEVPPPERVLLLNELTTQNQRAVAILAAPQASGDGPADDGHTLAREHLAQIQTLATAAPPAPAEARQWVKLLRNGEWAALPKPAQPQVAPTVAVASPAAVAVVADPAERARLRGEITELRTELCRAQAQLRRFNATIQLDEDQRAQWVKVTNDAYESALARAKEKLADFTIDFPEDKLNDRLGKATDPAERAKLERALRMLQHLKESYKLKDFATWAAHEGYNREEILEGVGIIADTIGAEAKIKDYLTKRWGLGRVIAFQEAASDLVTSAYDVTAEVVAWRRLNQLNQNSEDFLVAVDKSSQRVRAVVEGIRDRELRLGLDPGSTKDSCP